MTGAEIRRRLAANEAEHAELMRERAAYMQRRHKEGVPSTMLARELGLSADGVRGILSKARTADAKRRPLPRRHYEPFRDGTHAV